MLHAPTLKVYYKRDARDWKLILQGTTAEISAEKKASFAQGAQIVSLVCTSTDNSPTTGVRTADGSIFISSYESAQ